MAVERDASPHEPRPLALHQRAHVLQSSTHTLGLAVSLMGRRLDDWPRQITPSVYAAGSRRCGCSLRHSHGDRTRVLFSEHG